ncbi:MAG: KUP/HAK/KT family potassium transporter, partial [Pseudonocardiaceae bacterium]
WSLFCRRPSGRFWRVLVVEDRAVKLGVLGQVVSGVVAVDVEGDSGGRDTARRRRFACPAHSGPGQARRGYADDGITHVTSRFGYMETPDVPGALRALDPATAEGQLRTTRRPYYLSKIDLQRCKAPTMAPWRKRLFIATSHISADAAEYVGLTM